MKKLITLILYFACLGILSAQGLIEDKPLRGIWDFQLEKVWSIDHAGDEFFGMIVELRVMNDGTVIFRDMRDNLSYILNSDGHVICDFALQGSEPGKISRYLNCFSAKDQIVIGSPEKLHYFTKKGEYVKSISNNLFAQFPLHFISKDEAFFSTDTESIIRKDLRTGDEAVVHRFSTEEKEPDNGPQYLFLGLSVQLKIGVHEKTKSLYCGKNDKYEIVVKDFNGDIIRSFGLKRDKIGFTYDDKKRYFTRPQMGKDQQESLYASIPDELACFFKIQVIKDLVYIYSIYDFSRRRSQQPIDVFSLNGEYLYKGLITFDKDQFFANAENIVIYDDYVYVILYSDQGRKCSINKYHISLPENQEQ